MFFEYDVWIKSTISIIQRIDKMHSALIKMKFIQQKGGGGERPRRPTPKSAPAFSQGNESPHINRLHWTVKKLADYKSLLLQINVLYTILYELSWH